MAEQLGLVQERQLSSARNARTHTQHASLLRGIQRYEARVLWTWPNQAHITAQHIEQLWELVEPSPPQEGAQSRDSGVGRMGDGRALIERAHDHGPELVEREWITITANPNGAIEGWTRRIESNR